MRVAEITGVLSLATDLGMAQAFEHGLRSAVIAVSLGERLGLAPDALAEVYYVSLLLYIGCTAETSVFASFFGDDLEARERLGPVAWGSQTEMMRVALARLGAPATGVRRMAAAAQSLPGLKGALTAVSSGHCEVAQMLSRRLGLPGDYSPAFAAIYERWDGKGLPGRLGGEEVPLAVRVAQVADDLEIQFRAGDAAQAIDTVKQRAGQAFDPAIVSAAAAHGNAILATIDEGSVWERALAAEPAPHAELQGAAVDDALKTIADFADMKSPYLLGHSRGVADLAGAAAASSGLGPAETRDLVRAGLTHDVGRVAVPVTIWEKTGRLNSDDWERIRLHPYQSERVMAASQFMRPVAQLASLHHERLDGSGYHRGLDAAGLSAAARMLAAADAFRAMTERRPHRPALSPREAATRLEDEAGAGRLDREAVGAVLSAAGHGAAPRTPARPAGLTERELAVLRLLAHGKLTKQVAGELGIARKTADNHIQNIYAKIGVSTRAGATLFAVEHGLLAPAGVA